MCAKRLKQMAKKPVQRAPPEAKYISLDQAAVEIGCSRRYLEICIARKEFLPILRLGRRIRIPRSTIDKFLQKKLSYY